MESGKVLLMIDMNNKQSDIKSLSQFIHEWVQEHLEEVDE